MRTLSECVFPHRRFFPTCPYTGQSFLEGRMVKATTPKNKVLATLEVLLRQIIDEWYENVAQHYITQENLRAGNAQKEELKCFHDREGHRIKFNKNELDLTYGLRSEWKPSNYVIEISVNNKVENFDYHNFREKLLRYYATMEREQISEPQGLKNHTFQELFQLEDRPGGAFYLDIGKSKADVMRLSFSLSKRFVKSLLSNPDTSKSLIENYCVSPFRRIYATVYRQQKRNLS